jgi:hypothetical protein
VQPIRHSRVAGPMTTAAAIAALRLNVMFDSEDKMNSHEDDDSSRNLHTAREYAKTIEDRLSEIETRLQRLEAQRILRILGEGLG